MIVPVILSGGSGTRLWPLSREMFPKQLLPLVGEQTMLQATVTRLSGLPELGSPMVVCNEQHRFMVAAQLSAIHQPSAILLEPVGRNTAPAVALAALHCIAGGHDPLLLVLPADHVIGNSAALCCTISSGIPFAEDGKLITFGVVPTGPETGYGYIKAGLRLKAEGDNLKPEAYSVERFVEKPDRTTAENYLASGDYFWNSGMFLFRASRYLEELERFAPEMLLACRKALAGASRDLDFIRLDSEAFAACPSDSIDYAVMEKTVDAAVLPLDSGWNDIGSWSALWEIGEKDGEGNVSQGDVLTRSTRNCYLHGNGRMIATVGLEDTIVVETPDALLVARKDKVQDVKFIVEELKKRKRDEALLHRKVNRPWGTYECIDKAERFQVKRITVNPGATLSLQMHHHRAEHWIVVKGTARITRGEEVLTISENQSTYIPLGILHRLENPGKISLEIIEVQSGSYLGEDDIVRFEDNYGRS
jgi:mannose-1-phosphate guanylyltransferase/mannose-6-phosphate isomerase